MPKKVRMRFYTAPVSCVVARSTLTATLSSRRPFALLRAARLPLQLCNSRERGLVVPQSSSTTTDSSRYSTSMIVVATYKRRPHNDKYFPLHKRKKKTDSKTTLPLRTRYLIARYRTKANVVKKTKQTAHARSESNCMCKYFLFHQITKGVRSAIVHRRCFFEPPASLPVRTLALSFPPLRATLFCFFLPTAVAKTKQKN